jgi:hypothetical protein
MKPKIQLLLKKINSTAMKLNEKVKVQSESPLNDDPILYVTIG